MRARFGSVRLGIGRGSALPGCLLLNIVVKGQRHMHGDYLLGVFLFIIAHYIITGALSVH
jgi:hypothetical protein